MKNKTILITGGTGSLGQELAKQLFKLEVGKVIIYSRGEYAQYQMKTKWPNPGFPVRYFIGDVRDRERLSMAFAGVDIVIHCAALKHVDIGEYNPFEAVKTNVLGAQNVIEAAIKHNVERVVAISSDKAVNPVNLYGATKLCADKLFLNAHSYASHGKTTFAVIRFGNFWGSRGSVVPYFKKLAAEGVIALPITDFRMSRFFITLKKAAKFTLKVCDAKAESIYIPKMKRLNIVDIAKKIHPEVREIGLKPGEKLFEEMVLPSEVEYTYDSGGYYEISKGKVWGEKVPFGFSYNSDRPQLTVSAYDTKW